MAVCQARRHRCLAVLVSAYTQKAYDAEEQSLRCCNTQYKQRISTRHNNNIEVKACLTIVVWCI